MNYYYEKFYNITYNYLASNKPYSNDTPITDLFIERIQKIKELKERIRTIKSKEFKDTMKKYSRTEYLYFLNNKLIYLEKELKLHQNNNMELQKSLYKSNPEDSIMLRTSINIPLKEEKYKDYILNVLFYDNICCNKEVYKEYNKLTSKRSRLNFLKGNTEITHMYLKHKEFYINPILITITGEFKTNNKEITITPIEEIQELKED